MKAWRECAKGSYAAMMFSFKMAARVLGLQGLEEIIGATIVLVRSMTKEGLV